MDLKLLPWQRQQWEQFVDAGKADRVPHAILVSGPRGTGIEEFALCAAARLFCERPATEAVSCGTCRPCELFAAGSHPDYYRLDPDPELSKSGQILIDQVRELIHFIHLSRQFMQHRVALVIPADAMTRAAANALLKTLEEPPPASVIILATHWPASLPITVRSRCRHVQLRESYSSETLQWIERNAGGTTASATDLLQHARGAPLLATALAGEGALAARIEVLEDLAHLRSGHADPVAVGEKWSKLGAENVLEWLVGYTSQAARVKLSEGGPGAGHGGAGHLQRLADELDLSALVAFHDAVLAGWRRATEFSSLSARSILEDLIVAWLRTDERRGG